MCSAILWCLPPYLPGFIEAGLHCIYSGFFLIEAATYGLHLEQKFHGVLQILLINFYIVLLCILILRWHLDRHSLGCHLFISLTSCTLTVIIGQIILMYLHHMESTPLTSSDLSPPLKMDILVLLLDILVYLLITTSYILFLLKITLQIHTASKNSIYTVPTSDEGGSLPDLHRPDYLTRF